MLFWESKLIHKLRGKTYVPFLHFVGDEKSEDGKAYHVMVMDLLGKSLEDLFQECRRKFDLRTCLHIATQMVSGANNNTTPQKCIIFSTGAPKHSHMLIKHHFEHFCRRLAEYRKCTRRE